MSAPTPTRADSPAKLVLGFVLGGLAGLVVALVLGGAVAYASYLKLKADARRGWNLVPIVVAAVEIPTGTTITFDVISQRSIPEQFVTPSVVKPDSASYVVNVRAAHRLEAGQPLLWTSVEDKKLTKECAGAVLVGAAEFVLSPKLEAFLGSVNTRS